MEDDQIDEQTVEAIFGLLSLLRQSALKRAKMPRPARINLLTLDEVIRYFVENRPADPTVDHGALLVRRDFHQGNLCFQVFVDRDNKPLVSPSGSPHGRIMVAREIDSEILGLLSDGDLILFT